MQLRRLAASLWYGTRLLPWIADRSRYVELADELERAAVLSVRAFEDETRAAALTLSQAQHPAFTSYSECFGDIDVETVAELSRSLVAVYQTTRQEELADAIRRWWAPMVDVWSADGARMLAALEVDHSYRSLAPAWFALYLIHAEAAAQVGIDAFQAAFTARGIRAVIDLQASQTSPADLEQLPPPADGPVYARQGHGGWYHLAGDPFQRMGYNALVVEALLGVHRLICVATPPPAGSYWSDACARIPASLLASLAWLALLQNEPPASFAGTISSVYGTSDVMGTDTGAFPAFRILEEIRPDLSTVIVRDRDGSTASIESFRVGARRAALTLGGSFHFYRHFALPELLCFELSLRSEELIGL